VEILPTAAEVAEGILDDDFGMDMKNHSQS
jgi:hypothetical protein